MDSHRVDVFHVADRDAIVCFIADHFILNLLPASKVFLDEHLLHIPENLCELGAQLCSTPYHSGTLAAESKTSPHHNREADCVCCRKRSLDGAGGDAARASHIDFTETLHEEIAVLSIADARDRGAEHPNLVLLQETALLKLKPEIECSLAAKGKCDGVGTLLFDYPNGVVEREWKKIDGVRKRGVRLHGRDVRVHEYYGDTLFLIRLDCLRA